MRWASARKTGEKENLSEKKTIEDVILNKT
jgi:hypothetical protein